MSETQYIIGIDPGLNSTGICILEEKEAIKIIFLEEIITNIKDPIPLRLLKIYNRLDKILSDFPQIKIMGLEESFVNVNNKSSLKLGMVNGVILTLSAKYNLEVKFMASTHIKRKITGGGAATKESIKLFVDAIIPNINMDVFHKNTIINNNITPPKKKKVTEISHHLYDAIAIGIVAL
jgi:crossover junction endodeoxyribonuclease RuvC